MNHPLQCRCGTVKGRVNRFSGANHCVCYCRDCRAFAHYLGRPGEILDANGGTDIVQTRAADVSFTEGKDSLACMRLTPNGMLRWYTACCNTPIGNTLPNPKVSFVGLVHNFLEVGGVGTSDAFGPVRAHVNTESTRGKVQSSSLALVAVILRFIALVARARMDGSYRHTPFFSADTGLPTAVPKVLTPAEREVLLGRVDGVVPPSTSNAL
jgi:hypothetical protein